MENALKEQAIEYGHSTPEMAATFALASKAKRLCINHISPRYRPISTIKSKLSLVMVLKGKDVNID